MPTRERSIDRGTRLARAELIRIGAELRHARQAAGLSLTVVARAIRSSASSVSRIERGLTPYAPVVLLTQIGAAVGLDVRVRAYPGPDPLRDAAQVRLLERLRARLHPDLTVRLEVPLAGPGEQRAWDARISGLRNPAGDTVDLPVEAETRISDLQAQLRRLELKARDGGEVSVLLLVADTRRNRDVIGAARSMLAPAFPIPPRRALASLSEGAHPGGSALILL